MFKCLQFIDEMMKQLNEAELQIISEADEKPMENDTQMNNDEASQENSGMERDMDVESGENSTDGETDPNQIAEVDNGTFVSDLGKAEIAKSLLKALTLAKPNDSIPVEFQTVTTQNANDIIHYVKTMLQINNDEFGNELNNV